MVKLELNGELKNVESQLCEMCLDSHPCKYNFCMMCMCGLTLVDCLNLRSEKMGEFMKIPNVNKIILTLFGKEH